MGFLGELVVQIAGDNISFDDSIDQSEKKLNNFREGAKQVGKDLTTFVTLPIIGLGAAFIKVASDAEEVNSKFDAVFKEQSESVRDWAETFSDSVNRATVDNIGFLATIQDTLVPLGFARDAAAEMSKSVVELATDLASFNNLPTEQVIADIQSAIVGNTETLRKYGVVASQEAIIQEAINSGLIENKNQLDANSKAQAIYNLLVKGTADAQGDALRTADSFANQFRGLQAASVDLATGFGNILLPAVTDIVKGITGVINTFSGFDDAAKSSILLLAGIAAGIGPVIAAAGALSTALSLSPIGAFALVLGGITAAIAAVTLATKNSKKEFLDQADSIEKNRKEFGNLIERYKQLREKTNLTNEEQLEFQRIQFEIKREMPELSEEIDNQTLSIDKLNKKYEEWNDLQVEVEIRQLQRAQLELQKQHDDLSKAIDRETKNLRENQKWLLANGNQTNMLGVSTERMIKLLDEQLSKELQDQADIENELTEIGRKLAILQGEELPDAIDKETDSIKENTDAKVENKEETEKNIKGLNDSITGRERHTGILDEETESTNRLVKEVRAYNDELERTERTSNAAQVSAESFIDKLENVTSSVGNYISGVSGVWGQLNETVVSGLKNRETEIVNNFEKEKAIIEDSVLTEEEKNEKLAQLEKDKNEVLKQEKLKQFKANKAFGIIQSIIDTSLGVMNAFGQFPFPIAAVFAGIITAIGIAQTALIAAQQPPAFAEGGLVMPKPGGTNVIMAERGDPEFAIPDRADVMGRIADRISENMQRPLNNVFQPNNNFSTGPITIQIGNKKFAAMLTQMSKNGQFQIDPNRGIAAR